MKVGAENRKQVYVLIVLAMLAVISLAHMLLTTWGGTPQPAAAGPQPGPATRAARPGARRGRANQGRQVAVLAPTGDPRLRLDLLKLSEDTNYQGKGRNIFQPQMEDIPPPITPATPQPVVQQGPPPPPPINLKFFGFANRPGETRKVFLAKGDDVFIAGEGDIVDRRYKVVRIQPFSVEIEDVLNNNRQTIPLTQS